MIASGGAETMRPMKPRRAGLGLLVATLLLAPTVGHAQDARAHHDAGVELFELGRYEEAAAEFQRAHALSGRAHLLLNVARAQELAGQLAAAADSLEAYLQAEPDAPDAATLRVRVRNLRERVAASEAAPESVAEPPPPAAPEPAPSEPILPEPVSSAPAPVGPAILFGVAGASLVAAIVTGVVALDLHGSVSQRCDASGRCPPDARADIDTGVALTLTSDLLFGASALFAAAGALWWLLTPGGDDAPTVGAACTPTLCGASLRGAF